MLTVSRATPWSRRDITLLAALMALAVLIVAAYTSDTYLTGEYELATKNGEDSVNNP